jgi:hypothetical protein
MYTVKLLSYIRTVCTPIYCTVHVPDEGQICTSKNGLNTNIGNRLLRIWFQNRAGAPKPVMAVILPPPDHKQSCMGWYSLLHFRNISWGLIPKDLITQSGFPTKHYNFSACRWYSLSTAISKDIVLFLKCMVLWNRTQVTAKAAV